MMDTPPVALKLIPLFLIIAAIMYWASLMGQKLANAQMHELYDVSMAALAGNPPPTKSSTSNQNTPDEAVVPSHDEQTSPPKSMP